MDLKLIDYYVLIEKVLSIGLVDDEEILRLLQENCKLNYEGAVQALTSYYENKNQIKKYLKDNHLNQTLQSKGFQMGED